MYPLGPVAKSKVQNFPYGHSEVISTCDSYSNPSNVPWSWLSPTRTKPLCPESQSYRVDALSKDCCDGRGKWAKSLSVSITPNGGIAHISPTGRLPLATLTRCLTQSSLDPFCPVRWKSGASPISSPSPPPPGGYTVKCLSVSVCMCVCVCVERFRQGGEISVCAQVEML